MNVEIQGQVVSIVNQTITMKNNEQRAMQLVQIANKQNGQIVVDGFEVWDEQVQTFGLAQGQNVKVVCRMMVDTWGGRFRYTLRAFKCEQVAVQQEQQKQDPNNPNWL